MSTKDVILTLLKEAKRSGFIRDVVASKLLMDIDKDSDGFVSWSAFKFAINEISK